MANTESEKFRKPARWRKLYVVLFVLSAAWSFRGLLQGRQVPDYSLEDAVRLLQQPDADPGAACLALRTRINDAIDVLRKSGPHGTIAIEAIHKASKP